MLLSCSAYHPMVSLYYKLILCFAWLRPNVNVNGAKVVRVDDTTSCGDPATAGSGTVKVNGKPIHRKGDATGGHGSWVPNTSSAGSPDVNAG